MRLGLDRASAISVLRVLRDNSRAVPTSRIPRAEEIYPSPTSFRVEPDLISGVAENMDRAAQAHIQYTTIQREEMRRWEEHLEQMNARFERQTEKLERINTEVAQQRKLREKAAQRARLPRSYKCRCTLTGIARCGSCRRKVTKVSKSFYRKSSKPPFRVY